MDFSFFITVVVGAGTGSAIVQLIIQLGLGHWLQKKYHSYTLLKADRRNCADRIIDLISSKHSQSWINFNDDIYHTAYKLSDKLLSLGEKKYSITLDEYVSARRYAQEILMRVLSGTNDNVEDNKEFLDSQHKVDLLRERLIEAAKELKKK
jgi:hypothetical protein